MDAKQLADKFILSLTRQVSEKTHMRDGIYHTMDALRVLASISEELGEASSDLVRGRYYGVVAECLDIAHSALLLAITIDKDGLILDSHYERSYGQQH